MSSVSTAVAQQTNGGALATLERHRADLTLVLPSHINAESWYASTRAALSRNADLMAAAQASPQTLIDALHDAARLGLQPGTEEYYLTPRKEKGVAKVLGISGYQGEVELIYRAGAVSTVKVELVRKNDVFRYSPGEHDRPQHEVDWFGDRGDVVGAYAYAVMKDTGATSKVVVVDKARIDRAKAAAASASSERSPWVTDYGAMVLKTAAHDLTKWVPTSAEYRREELRAARDVAAETPSSQRSAVGAPPVGAPPVSGGSPERTGAPDVIEGEVVTEPVGPALGTGTARMTGQHQKRLFDGLRGTKLPLESKEWASQVLGLDKTLKTWGSLTCDQAVTLITRLESGDIALGGAAAADPEPEPAASAPAAPAPADAQDVEDAYRDIEADRDAAQGTLDDASADR